VSIYGNDPETPEASASLAELYHAVLHRRRKPGI